MFRNATPAFAAVAVVALLGTQVLGALHLAFVEHRVCDEHGDLIHAADATRQPCPHVDEAVRTASNELLGTAGERDGAHAHHACGVFAPRRAEPAIAASGATEWLVGPAGEAVVCVERASHDARAEALYRLAPKGSPPLAGV